MARQQPSQNTYQTKTIKLIRELSNRGSNTDKDEDYFNCYPELIKNRATKEDNIILVKRDGSELFITPPVDGAIRGMYFWQEQNKLFIAVQQNIYTYNASTGALLSPLVGVFSTTSGTVGFTEFLYDDGAVKIVITDGTTMMTIDPTGTQVVGADVDMPVHLPYPVFLDGYLFIIKADTADLYNSNLNDPLAYTPGDFLTAEMIPDRALWLSRLNNYIVVVGNQSIEYFWNAAIATGSPLQRNDTPIKLTGIIGGTATLGNKLYLVASHNTSQPEVFVLDDFKIKSISNEAIRRHLKSIVSTNITTIRGSIVSLNGHDFYVINTGVACYACNLESLLWCRWGFQTDNNFNFTSWINAETSAGYKSFFSIGNSSIIYNINSSLYQDTGITFPMSFVTSNNDFGSWRQKSMSHLVIKTDKPISSAPALLQWTDDDYQSYNDGITVELFQERPDVKRLGRFRRRAFKFTFTQNQPLRIEEFEVDINLGQH